MAKSHDEIWDEWEELINMTAHELDGYLESKDSRAVGAKDDGGESTGHESGRRIVELIDRNRSDLTDDDWDHMGKVVGYVKRHLAQGGPDEDMETSRWRYSLMNWGHDPAK
jgi:hypothetical protein